MRLFKYLFTTKKQLVKENELLWNVLVENSARHGRERGEYLTRIAKMARQNRELHASLGLATQETEKLRARDNVCRCPSCAALQATLPFMRDHTTAIYMGEHQ